jgi:hypothetical protein
MPKSRRRQYENAVDNRQHLNADNALGLASKFNFVLHHPQALALQMRITYHAWLIVGAKSLKDKVYKILTLATRGWNSELLAFLHP